MSDFVGNNDEKFQRSSSLYDTIDPEGQHQDEQDEEFMEPTDQSELPEEVECPNQNSSASENMKVKPIILDDIDSMKCQVRSLTFEQKVVGG